MSVPNHVKHVEQIEPALAEIVDKLVAAFDPERIYLFGSRARGDARPDSDYDVMLVLAGSAQRGLPHVRKACAALSELTEPTDVLVLNHDEFWRATTVVASLPATILREGKLLYSSCAGLKAPRARAPSIRSPLNRAGVVGHLFDARPQPALAGFVLSARRL